MKKRMCCTPAENAVMFEGKKYSVAAQTISSVRLVRPGEDIIVHPSRVHPITDQAKAEATNDRISQKQSVEKATACRTQA